jgi:uncharacterized protein (TIGR02145 family)
LKYNFLKRISDKAVFSNQRISKTTAATQSLTMKKLPTSGALIVQKEGYFSSQIRITKLDTSDLVIKVQTCPLQVIDTVTDFDGNVYHTIKIGNQIWTMENLRTTRFRDGTAIPLITDNNAWGKLTTPGFCYYNNTKNADTIKKFGAMYNWYVVDSTKSQKVAPAGWHVPNDSDWKILEKYLARSGYSWNGTVDTNGLPRIAKSLAAKTDWKIDTTHYESVGFDLTCNNNSGFSAFPGGRLFDNKFEHFGEMTTWWSAPDEGYPTTARTWTLYNSYGWISWDANVKSDGLSIRLVKNNQ